MPDCSSLLPPARVIHERLTRNQRERHLLRALLRLTLLDTDENVRQKSQNARYEAVGRDGGQ